jgi:hypothetical protein
MLKGIVQFKCYSFKFTWGHVPVVFPTFERDFDGIRLKVLLWNALAQISVAIRSTSHDLWSFFVVIVVVVVVLWIIWKEQVCEPILHHFVRRFNKPWTEALLWCTVYGSLHACIKLVITAWVLKLSFKKVKYACQEWPHPDDIPTQPKSREEQRAWIVKWPILK